MDVMRGMDWVCYPRSSLNGVVFPPTGDEFQP
jgi:hypothetical protein